jgi:hypothetical protein
MLLTSLHTQLLNKENCNKGGYNMANKGIIFRTGDYFHNGDYLVSANGLFCVCLNDDGNLCISRGSTPDSSQTIWCSGNVKSKGLSHCAYLHDNGNLCIYNSELPDSKTNTWCSKNCGPVGSPHCAYLHDDGNLCIYNSEWPNGKTCMWCSGPTDPLVDISEITKIEYDLNAAKILQSGPAELFRQTVVNQTDELQTSSVNGSASVTETSGWSDSLAVKIGISTTFVTKVPFIFEGKVTASVEVTNTYTWNGSTSKTKTWGFNTPVNVPPHSTRVCLISVTNSTISVPYKLMGIALLKSGRRLPITIHGVYIGSNSHDLLVTIIKMDSITHKAETAVQKISNVTSKYIEEKVPIAQQKYKQKSEKF